MSDLYLLSNGSHGNAQAKISDLFAIKERLERELAREKLRAEDNGKLAHDTAIQLAETAKDYRCLAELLDGHDATECRENLLALKAELSAERALSDRLAHWLSSLECEAFFPPQWEHTIGQALAAWKAARNQSLNKPKPTEP